LRLLDEGSMMAVQASIHKPGRSDFIGKAARRHTLPQLISGFPPASGKGAGEAKQRPNASGGGEA
jgi:hypothetical protein